jgi:hypothetical protein
MSTVVPLKPRTRKPADLLQLRIELAEIKPAIWRRIVVPSRSPLQGHDVIQCVMGWTAGICTNSSAGDATATPTRSSTGAIAPFRAAIQLKTWRSRARSRSSRFRLRRSLRPPDQGGETPSPEPIPLARELCSLAPLPHRAKTFKSPGYVRIPEVSLDPDHPEHSRHAGVVTAASITGALIF